MNEQEDNCDLFQINNFKHFLKSRKFHHFIYNLSVLIVVKVLKAFFIKYRMRASDFDLLI